MKITPYTSALVAGGGAWGTALACLLARNGVHTTLWVRNTQLADTIRQTRENAPYLPGITLPETLHITDAVSAIKEVDMLVFVVPAQAARQYLGVFAAASAHTALPVTLCCKGIEQGTGALMSTVLADVWPEAIPAVLSGPSFASDVAKELPTAVTLACAQEHVAHRLQRSLHAPHFRPYVSADIMGTELGGVFKNVLAIACGIVSGLQLGESAKAALMARGFAELQRLAIAMQAAPETVAGLSGLGDLILTCSSPQSRNMSFGMELANGKDPQNILASRRTVSEGVASVPGLLTLAESRNVDMPICAAIRRILTGEDSVQNAVNALLQRPVGLEHRPSPTPSSTTKIL